MSSLQKLASSRVLSEVCQIFPRDFPNHWTSPITELGIANKFTKDAAALWHDSVHGMCMCAHVDNMWNT